MDQSLKLDTIVIDCQSVGISGDRIVAALIDLGVDSEKVIKSMESSKEHIEGCKSLNIEIHETSRSGFRAKQIEIKADENKQHRSGNELISAVSETAKELDLSSWAKEVANSSIRTLVDAESKLHGKRVDDVVLHEAGSIDTVVDIIGVASALDILGASKSTKIFSTPVALGGGLFKFSHGTMTSPAPATLEILTRNGFDVVGGPLDFELSTPTGVSILTSLAEKTLRYFPEFKPQAIGYGAGSKEFDNVPNILRIITGEMTASNLVHDEVLLLETNLDDVTGETIGFTMDRLLSAGAKDVSIIPIIEKKSRPGWIISIMAEEKDVDRLTEILTLETGTLGVRTYPCHRRILTRESKRIQLNVQGEKHEVDVKIARDRLDNIVNVKPEYDDIRALALKLNRPFIEIHEKATEQAKKDLMNK
ncbi:nickel pincer cofactor biosynthesis protein LarC [[Eubacterium] cellulosolvens]